jgi:hypothetical protein
MSAERPTIRRPGQNRALASDAQEPHPARALVPARQLERQVSPSWRITIMPAITRARGWLFSRQRRGTNRRASRLYPPSPCSSKFPNSAPSNRGRRQSPAGLAPVARQSGRWTGQRLHPRRPSQRPPGRLHARAGRDPIQSRHEGQVQAADQCREARQDRPHQLLLALNRAFARRISFRMTTQSLSLKRGDVSSRLCFAPAASDGSVGYSDRELFTREVVRP